MNVNPSSADFTKTVAWDSLTEEQKASGDWILLPEVSGEARQARRESAMSRAFARQDAAAAFVEPRRRSFDATGRPR